MANHTMQIDLPLFKILVEERSQAVAYEKGALQLGNTTREEIEELITDILSFKGQGEDFTSLFAKFGITRDERFIYIEDVRKVKTLFQLIDEIEFQDEFETVLLPKEQFDMVQIIREHFGGTITDSSADYLASAAEALYVLITYAEDLGRL